MEVKFDEIDEVIANMDTPRLRMTLLILAVKIKDQEVIDKIDYVDSVKIGLSLAEG